MKLFNEMAVIGDDSLDPGPERLAGFCHGVPVKGPHQRLHLTEQVLDFFAKLCIDMTQKRPTQNSLKGCSQASREARPPSLIMSSFGLTVNMK
jgi:hypothetical protein